MAEAQPIGTEKPRDFDLIQIAAEFLEAERFDYATIAIQTAVEIYVERRLRTILAWRDLGPLGDLLTKLVRPPYNFTGGDRQQALWTSLTRDAIQSHREWWERYTKHVDRRSRIVHKGAHVSREDVEESFDVALTLMDHVNRVMIETGVRLGKLAEVGSEPRSDPDPY